MGPAPNTTRFARALALAGLLGLGACGAEDLGEAPDIIVISLDTLRADRLSCYGYERRITPRLDAFAAGATRYERCVATAPWTVPSHASLFTGRFPFEHGAVSTLPEIPEGVNPLLIDNARPLNARATTLAEALGVAGYSTAGIVANSVYLAPRMQLDQGFETWQVMRPWRRGEALSSAWGDSVNAAALEWVRAHEAQEDGPPFFLFLNYFDTHRPYDIAPESANTAFDEIEALYRRVLIDGLPPGELGETVSGRFDVALVNLDRYLGQLFEGLEELGVLDGALVIVTSDHGEYFGEHALVEHSKDVYDEALSVPLIVKRPGQREGRVESRPASLVDVPGLILESLPRFLRRRHAATFPWRLGEHPLLSENHFSRTKDLTPALKGRFHRRRIAVEQDGLKLILTFAPDGAFRGAELYDLAADAREEHDLAAQRPDDVARLSGVWRELASRRGARANDETDVPALLTEEQAQDLRNLGYAGDDEQ